MKKIFILFALALLSGATYAQNMCVVSGYPTAKKSPDALVGALVTFTNEWDSDIKHRRKVTADGFEIIVPAGGYLLTIESEGYETYRLEIEVDQTRIDLGMITLLTVEQAAAREAKRKARARRY